MIWLHGERDHLVPLDVGMEHIEIFEESGWPVTRLEHEKGHMVNLNQFEEMREQVQKIAKNSQRLSIRWSDPPTNIGESCLKSKTTGTVLWPVSTITSCLRPS